MQTREVDHLFRSDADFASDQRRARKQSSRVGSSAGRPIKLSSKILALSEAGCEKGADQGNGEGAPSQTEKPLGWYAWSAESAFVTRRIDLLSQSSASSNKGRVFKGHTGPVSSIERFHLRDNASDRSTSYLATGSWDKSIAVWSISVSCSLMLSPHVTHG